MRGKLWHSSPSEPLDPPLGGQPLLQDVGEAVGAAARAGRRAVRRAARRAPARAASPLRGNPVVRTPLHVVTITVTIARQNLGPSRASGRRADTVGAVPTTVRIAAGAEFDGFCKHGLEVRRNVADTNL